MRGLFLKIFAIFWIAQTLIFLISTALILRHRRPSPGIIFDTLFSSLRSQARETASAFESGGCATLDTWAAAHHQNIALEDAEGRELCGATAPASPGTQVVNSYPEQITGTQAARQYIWKVPVVSASGQRYFFLLIRPHIPEKHHWYQDLLHFAFPQLLVAIAVGGATTYALVLLFTRPLVRLRTAARELAGGRLDARVPQAAQAPHVFEEDEFKALVHDFNHMADRLESLVSAQRLLLRDVSHELRSPLARLSVALELAREDAAPEMAAHLNRIGREAERLNQLIGQLLTLSSMEALEKADNIETISLRHLVDEIIPDAEYEARQQQTPVTFSAAEECVIAGNRELLYRAIENVVRNAIRYTTPGSGVEIRLTSSQDNGRRTAVLEVSDHGPGIPESETDAIFRPFYRVDRARSSDTGGFGVGLAIAERAVRLHHGELHAFNREGGGATIRMSFPAAQQKAG